MKKILTNAIILFAVIIVIMIMAAVIRISIPHNIAENPEVSQGLYLLSEMEERDVVSVQDEIEKLTATTESEESRSTTTEEATLSAKKIKALDFKKIFSNSVIIGDSIVEGMADYGFLNSSEVFFKPGISCRSADEQMNRAKALNPKYVFLYLGFNDISHDHYDYDRFTKDFSDLLDSAKEIFPNAKIYVNSLFPAKEPLTKKQPWYKKINKYNSVIKKICKEHKVNFINNKDIVKDEHYSADGYHFQPELYPYWLYNMAKGAGLL